MRTRRTFRDRKLDITFSNIKLLSDIMMSRMIDWSIAVKIQVNIMIVRLLRTGDVLGLLELGTRELLWISLGTSESCNTIRQIQCLLLFILLGIHNYYIYYYYLLSRII